MDHASALPASLSDVGTILEEIRHEDGRLVAWALCAVGVILLLGAAVFLDWLHGSILGTLLVLTSLATYALLRRTYLAGVWLLVVGCMASELLALHWYPSAGVAALLALPTGMATLFIGGVGGLAAALFASGVIVAWRESGVPVLSGAETVAVLVAIWGVMALIWTFAWRVQRTIQWTWENYKQARHLLEEAREQSLELKQIQEDLAQANSQLARLTDRLKAMHQVAEEARRAKEEFVARVSHELRTPLNMIIGFADMIRRAPHVYGTKLPSALLADIATIQRNAQHLASLVDDVLALSQMEAERMTLTKEWASLQEIVETAVLAVRPLFESKGLSLEVEIPAHLPQIFCDSTRIRQVLLNLLSNAGRFTEQGGVKVKVRREDDKVIVSVADTGPGIAPEKLKRVFEPFEQLDSTLRRRYGGSGLGLSISKRFVEMHEGKMWLESEVGKGTTVYFSLPFPMPSYDTSLEENAATRWLRSSWEYEVRTRPSKAPEPRLVPRFVLLERGDTLQRLFSRQLGDTVEIVSVRDGEGALHALAQAPAQALIVNDPSLGHMPASAGWLMNLPYDTPMLACWIPGEDEAAERLGVVRYLVKPITCETLLTTLGSLGEQVKTVLLVDDEPEALQLFARMLASAARGYRVLRATNGRQALALLRSRKPDVMLLDLIMPEMNGFEVLQEKSRDPALRSIPVIVISARDPIGEPIVSDTLTVTRKGGLSVGDLLACIRSISQILSPPARPDGQERSERFAA